MKIYYNGEIIEVDCELYDPFPPKEEPKTEDESETEKPWTNNSA